MSQQVKSNEEIWRDFGIWIRKKRKAVGMTQKAVAAAAKIHENSYGRIERGKDTGTKRETVIAIANAIRDCDVTEALDRTIFSDGELNDVSDQDRNKFESVISKFTRLSPRGQDLAHDQITHTIDYLLKVETLYLNNTNPNSTDDTEGVELPSKEEFDRNADTGRKESKIS